MPAFLRSMRRILSAADGVSIFAFSMAVRWVAEAAENCGPPVMKTVPG